MPSPEIIFAGLRGDADSWPDRIDSVCPREIQMKHTEQPRSIRNISEALVCSLKGRSMSPPPPLGECTAGHRAGNDTPVNIWWRDWGAVIQYSLRLLGLSVLKSVSGQPASVTNRAKRSSVSGLLFISRAITFFIARLMTSRLINYSWGTN